MDFYEDLALILEKEEFMDLVKHIQYDIDKIDGRKTKLYRDIAKAYKKEISNLDITSIYTICESLLENRNWAETTIAYQIIFDNKNKYDESTFLIFEKWLYKYIEDWWDCDDFMTHSFQYLLMKYPENMIKLKTWVNHDKFAVRRSAAVILIRPAQKGLLEKNVIFEVCDLLKSDSHYLVQKGYGWLLKEASKHYHDSVVQYLESNVLKMSRTSFRYALEKLPIEEKVRLMNL